MFQETTRLEDLRASKSISLQRKHEKEQEDFELSADHMDDLNSSWKHRSISSISSVSSTSSTSRGGVENNGRVVQKNDDRMSVSAGPLRV